MTEFSLSELLEQCSGLPAWQQTALHRLLEQIRARTERKQPVDREWQRWQALREKGLQWLTHRIELRPLIQYDEQLPVVQARREILDTIAAHQVVIIAGETGSGKTTQLPKMCLELGLGIRGVIGHTQPRRLAATSVARRIADELRCELGKQVGYAIRFDQQISDDSLIAVMTDGVLLQALKNDPLLTRYDCLIIDEAHERSLNIDLLLGYLKNLLPQRPDLKIIITSATIDPERFARYFNDAPVLSVSGRTYPVSIRYRDVQDDDGDIDTGLQILQALDELWAESPGDALVFLSGEGEIRDVANTLRRHKVKAEVLPLYARLPMSEQQKVFSSGGRSRVVLATNVAETSLTVPGIRYVIDCGKARISRYSQGSRVQRLPIEKIAQASANQRAGRCGRVMNGVCVRLYSEQDFLQRDLYSTPEILRTALADLLLQMIALGITDIESFPFIDAPDTKRISDGLRYLQELGAINDRRELTSLGRQMCRLPLPPSLSRILLAAHEEHCLSAAIIVVAFLCLRDPRERPIDKADAATGLHRRFFDADSDFIAILNLWRYMHELKEQQSGNAWRKQLKAEFLNVVTLIEWGRLVAQLRAQCQEIMPKAQTATMISDPQTQYRALHRALVIGLFHQIGQQTRDGDYQGARNIRFVAHPSSVLHKKPKPWVLASDFLDGTKLYGLLLAKIEVEWLEQLCTPLLKRHYEDPVWRASRGDAVVNEQVSLFGLKLVTARPVSLSRIDVHKARMLFVLHGLLRNEIDLDLPFHRHNQRLLKSVADEEERGRRRDLLRSEEELTSLFLSKLPEQIVDKHSLLKWQKQNPHTASLLQLTEADIRAVTDRLSDDDFPPEFYCNGQRLKLVYRFCPGEVYDGVTVQVPLSLLHHLEDDAFDVLVPGFLPGKIEAVLRGLPKELRKELMPIADTVKALLPLAVQNKSIWSALSDALYREKRVRISAAQLSSVMLADNLCMYIEVRESGKVLAKGRDLPKLKAELLKQREQGMANDAQQWTKQRLLQFPEQAIPYSVPAGISQVFLAFYDEVSAVSIKPVMLEIDARRLHKKGVVRLLNFALQPDFKQYQRHNKPLNQLLVHAAAFPSNKQLLDEWLSAAIVSSVPDDVWMWRDRQSVQTALHSLPAQVRSRLADSLPKLVELFALAAQIQLRCNREIRTRLPEVATDIDDWLNDIVGIGFLHEHGLDDLRHVRRYLDAVRLRVEQCISNPARELQRFAQWQQWQARVQPLLANDSLQWRAELSELKRLMREWRVAIFAQSVGTDGPVSEKRLLAQLQQVEESRSAKR